MRNGPCSLIKVDKDEQPGPPFVQISNGSVSASLSDSTKTVKMDLVLLEI